MILNTSDEKFALDLLKNVKRQKLSNGTYTGLTDKVFMVVAGKGSKNLNSAGSLLVKNVTLESVGEVLTTIRNKI